MTFLNKKSKPWRYNFSVWDWKTNSFHTLLVNGRKTECTDELQTSRGRKSELKRTSEVDREFANRINHNSSKGAPQRASNLQQIQMSQPKLWISALNGRWNCSSWRFCAEDLAFFRFPMKSLNTNTNCNCILTGEFEVRSALRELELEGSKFEGARKVTSWGSRFEGCQKVISFEPW